MKAPFLTDGYTTTHSDLFSRSVGIPLSGVARISLRTSAEFFRRSSSFCWPTTGRVEQMHIASISAFLTLVSSFGFRQDLCFRQNDYGVRREVTVYLAAVVSMVARNVFRAATQARFVRPAMYGECLNFRVGCTSIVGSFLYFFNRRRAGN